MLKKIAGYVNRWKRRDEEYRKELLNLRESFSSEITELKDTILENNRQIGQDITTIINRMGLDVNLRTQRQFEIFSLHKDTFSRFKGINSQKSVVLVATGPTVNQFEASLVNDAVYIGVNKAFLLSNITFDYLFAIDKASIADVYEDFFSYECTKFVGDQNLGPAFQIPESYMLKNNVLRYKTTANLFPDVFFQDIDTAPLANSCSVAIQAMQFALFTNPRKIYLVGNDCTVSKAEHFYTNPESFRNNLNLREEPLANNEQNLLASWRAIKEFAKLYYPETEIISVNPVNLKGLFKEVEL
ncbi:MAG: hypothetical protein ACLVFZ_08500 [Parasutterella sp.]|uniref:hypothetical protein n=1 Tax=Parasutterella sp. TaxID=2049037 RepID=UPI00399BB019